MKRIIIATLLLSVGFMLGSSVPQPHADAQASVNLCVSVPSAQATRVVQGVSAQYGYTPTIPDPANPSQQIANPQTRQQFVVAVLKKFVVESLKASEATTAAEDARKAAAKKVDDEVVIPE